MTMIGCSKIPGKEYARIVGTYRAQSQHEYEPRYDGRIEVGTFIDLSGIGAEEEPDEDN